MLRTHGDQKYQASEVVHAAAEWQGLRIEHRRIGPGAQNCVTPTCMELVHIIAGQAKVTRRANGETQQGLARPGTTWLVPAGTHETLLELDGATECLLVFLPDTLIEQSVLADYGIDPDRVQIAYAGGICDPVLTQACTTLHGLLGHDTKPVDHLLADAMRTTLAARLLSHYTVDRLEAQARPSSLDGARLRRVLDLVEDRLAETLSLEDLAAQACLSPFHFSRLFQKAMGRSPHRYLLERRVQAARDMLAQDGAPLAAIALDAGFGSQANFTRTFRKITGVTPGRYRELRQR